VSACAALTAVGTPYALMVAGRFVFGVGEGAIFIALVAGLAQWFSRSGIALAAALYLSLARVGSYAVDTSRAWASPLYERGWQPPLWLGAGIAVAGLIAALLYYWLDRHYRPGAADAAGGERVDWRHLLKFDGPPDANTTPYNTIGVIDSNRDPVPMGRRRT
jgi:MFS family permease